MNNKHYMQSSMSRILAKTLQNDIAIITAYRFLEKDAPKKTQQIEWGVQRSDGRREILTPTFLRCQFAMNRAEANELANRRLLSELQGCGFDVTSVEGTYIEKGSSESTHESSLIVENDGDTIDSFVGRILSVTCRLAHDEVFILPKVDNLKSSYIFLTTYSKQEGKGEFIGKFAAIAPKDAADTRAKIIEGNKQIVYDVDWSRPYNVDMLEEYLRRRREGERTLGDDDYEELVQRDYLIKISLERDFLTKRKGAYGALTDKDMERIREIDEILNKAYSTTQE